MIRLIQSVFQRISWRTKLILSGSAAIFLTFFLFSFLEYNFVSKWMMNREEMVVKRTMADIFAYYKYHGDKLTEAAIKKSGGFLTKLNDKDQLIRVYNNKGKVLASDQNGSFPVLEPSPVNKNWMGNISAAENEAIVARFPLKEKHFQGTIEIVRGLNLYKKMMDHLFLVMTSFGVGAILFSTLSGFFLAEQLLKPIRELARTMKKIKENGFQDRMVVYKQKGEITALSNLFNELMDEIEQSFIHQKQFIEDASHELRTPVSILEGHLSLLNRWGKKDPAILDESLQACLQEVSRLKKLVVDLLELTRAENSRNAVVQEFSDITQSLQQLIKNLEIIHPEFQFQLFLDHYLEPVWISEQHLQQIFIILIDNAIKYSGEIKKIRISAVQTDLETILTVEDFGIGIPQEHVSDVFSRFYRVDKARNREKGGTGLGLSIAKRLIEKYKGKILIESQEGKGTKVSFQLQNAEYGERQINEFFEGSR